MIGYAKSSFFALASTDIDKRDTVGKYANSVTCFIVKDHCHKNFRYLQFSFYYISWGNDFR